MIKETARTRVGVGLLALVALLSCTEEKTKSVRFDPELARHALNTYAEIASASYGDAVVLARALRGAIEGLLASPSDSTLAAARSSWRNARAPYAQSEAFRFYDGPIDQVELLLNTWPIDENFVEGTPEGPDKGVIDDPARFPELDQALLVSLNARDGETSISTGYHVIEFLLWGRDVSSDGPGARPACDFDASTNDPLIVRRRVYLQLASALLLQHLEQVERAWRPGDERNYRSDFLRRPPREALGLALRGMGSLSGPELSGERLTVPYETRDQENEHSCFSDTTRDDIVADALGLQNVCLGRYERSVAGPAVRGPGLCDLLATIDPALGATLKRQVEASLAAARKIPTPFDRALLGKDDAPGRRAIKQTIVALEAQTATVARAAALLAVTPQRVQALR